MKKNHCIPENTKIWSECLRCGKCCQRIPCMKAQRLYGLTKTNKKCPDLIKDKDGKYTCLRFKLDEEFKASMLNGMCELNRMKKNE